jgi:hypothetical protein
MVKLWSESPSARSKELVADIATAAWVSLWVVLASRLYATLAGYADAGRALQQGGKNLQDVGGQVGNALDGVPLVGEGIGDLSRSGFEAAGDPFIYVGGELASLLILIAGLLGALVLAVTLIPWLTRYLPWRARRLAELRHAHRAIRGSAPGVSTAEMDRFLAVRALNRLPYEDLLARSPDPFGDFAAGRYDRLAAAELASVGLVSSTTGRAR